MHKNVHIRRTEGNSFNPETTHKLLNCLGLQWLVEHVGKYSWYAIPPLSPPFPWVNDMQPSPLRQFLYAVFSFACFFFTNNFFQHFLFPQFCIFVKWHSAKFRFIGFNLLIYLIKPTNLNVFITKLANAWH